ncbi:NF-kappa-B inhibitor cactus [Episyrphus balteatus]|uniref:NF-kappa-B inhibitor cactus n=1 Tax=Episyrphus balteatus TaxID=286459 RepID=UPI0024854083|nr:NF-kappa-B inhibitor cactus [Episyrphus balteatus]XP_055849834.1 NF-kappa-B inhibitor cactus [Episyrphus balteatus]
MWNQNQNSDNNNKNKQQDVSVVASETTTTNNFVEKKIVVETSKAGQQQHLHSASGNGKTGVGGSESNNFDHSTTSKDKDNYTSSTSEGAIDSGFLSGPQLSEDFEEEDFGNSHRGHSSSGGGNKSINHPPVQLNIVHSKQKKSTENYLDSGCIDEDFDDEDVEVELEPKVGGGHSHSRPAITTTAASPQQRGGSGTQQDDDEQMILDKGVDSGVSEWFCKLTLRDPNQQVNNLGTTQRVAGSGTTTNNSNSDMASWEIYYQQNNEGDTQLHLACITGYVDVVAALIRMAPHPCLFNIQNDEAQTSLHLAVIYGQPKILRMLLIAGAEPTARDRHGNTPLHLACISGDTQCVKALTIPISASEINEAHRSYGHLSSDKTTSYLDCARLPADLEIRNYDGERCVHLAAQGGHIDILRHLVWFGADINAREGKSGRTSLHIAIECCNEILANFLLEECSTLNIETATYAGLTAYQVACILDNPIMQNHLEKNGAQTLTPPDSDYDSSDIETDLDDSQMYSRFGDPRYFANYNGGGNPINVA